ncbi:MAG: polyphosphate polymerase domain-containing protein [Clostridia bacterium]|nr:polyphosphate polymerase domain-containing protein [Clostridia bacterium]
MPKEPLCIFRRIEKKYLLTQAQKQALLRTVSTYFTPDAYGKSTVESLYLDTPDYRLIRTSIDASGYKEKLRLRSYGIPKENDKVFLELKKKYKGVVYKRRVAMTSAQACRYLNAGERPFDSQIMRELDYTMGFYGYPRPAAMISCEREAFFSKENDALRMTFDTGIRYRRTELSLSAGAAGKLLLPSDLTLMEIKTDGAMPLWLSHALDAARIYPTSFSKYGTAYLDFSQNTQILKGDPSHA